MAAEGSLLIVKRYDAATRAREVIGFVSEWNETISVGVLRSKMRAEGVVKGEFRFTVNVGGTFAPVSSLQENSTVVAKIIDRRDKCVYVELVGEEGAAPRASAPAYAPPYQTGPGASSAAFIGGNRIVMDSSSASASASASRQGDRVSNDMRPGFSEGARPPPRPVPVDMLVRELFNFYVFWVAFSTFIPILVMVNVTTPEPGDPDGGEPVIPPEIGYSILAAVLLLTALLTGGKQAWLLRYGVPVVGTVISQQQGCVCGWINCYGCSGTLKSNGMPMPKGGWEVSSGSYYGAMYLSEVELLVDGQRFMVTYGSMPYKQQVMFIDPKRPWMYASIEDFGTRMRPDEFGNLRAERGCCYSFGLVMSVGMLVAFVAFVALAASA